MQVEVMVVNQALVPVCRGTGDGCCRLYDWNGCGCGFYLQGWTTSNRDVECSMMSVGRLHTIWGYLEVLSEMVVADQTRFFTGDAGEALYVEKVITSQVLFFSWEKWL